MKMPLHQDEVFGNIWRELFDKKGACIPTFQHSDKLKALLVAAQKEDAKPVGLPATHQPLKVILECFSFAKQRFDSTVDPVAKAAIMSLPIATVLAFTASDSRVQPWMRKRAKESLDFLTSKNVRGLALSADWGIVWESFLRLFDAGDHDIAGSSEEIDGLTECIQKLFVEGAVFQDTALLEPLDLVHQPAIGGAVLAPTISHNMQAAGVNGQFISTIVKKQLAHTCVFNVGGQPVLLWGALPPSDEVELANRIQNVAKVSIGRVRSEFTRLEMRFFLRAFSMRLVREAFKPQGIMESAAQDSLTRCCQNALNSMRSPESDEAALASAEYKALATLLAGLTEPGQPLAGKSNREVWGNCLDSSFLREHLPGKSFVQIPKLVRYYLSIIDGSCGVERGLAKVRAFISESLSTNIAVLDDLAVLVDANLQPGDVAKTKHGHCEACSFGLECGALWRDVLGARLGIYNKSGTFKAKPGTYKNVKAGVLKAIGAAIVSKPAHQSNAYAHQQMAADEGTPSMATILAARQTGSGNTTAGTDRSPYWHAGFTSVSLHFCQSGQGITLWGLCLVISNINFIKIICFFSGKRAAQNPGGGGGFSMTLTNPLPPQLQNQGKV